jgi:hypothetical protein
MSDKETKIFSKCTEVLLERFHRNHIQNSKDWFHSKLESSSFAYRRFKKKKFERLFLSNHNISPYRLGRP